MVRRHLCGDRRGTRGRRRAARRRRYEWAGGPSAAPVGVPGGGADPLATVHDEMERQLNLAFPAAGRFDPFRVFVVADEASFHLGIAYDHFVAGRVSRVLLLPAFVEDYCGIARSD